jgi:hypothetical protein
VLRARYQKAAMETDLSAQNLAVSDFMKSPVLVEIDLSAYTGQAGELIKVVAEEGRVGAAEVSIVIADAAKTVLEQGKAAAQADGVSWWYAARIDVPPDQPLWITVSATDQPGNQTVRTLRHTTWR